MNTNTNAEFQQFGNQPMNQNAQPQSQPKRAFNPSFVQWNFDRPAILGQYDSTAPTYEGEMDTENLSHGQGTMTYMDGSTYVGAFEHGLTHGQGTWKNKEGDSYVGEWKRGFKDGEGTFTYVNGDKIEATWKNNRLNGSGTFSNQNTGTSFEAVWKEDIMIPMGNQDKGCYDRAYLNLFFVVGALGCAIGVLVMMNSNNNTAIILLNVAIALWVIQFFECCCASTFRYVKNIEPLNQVSNIINDLKRTRPEIVFTIQNYHHETRTTTDSKGVTRTTQVRVNTHYAKENFCYNQWTDLTAEPSSIGYITELHLTRLKFCKDFSFTSCANQDFYAQIAEFKEHNITDHKFDFNISKNIPGYRENVLVYNETKGGLPWYCSCMTFWLFAFFGLSWIIRMKLVNNSTQVRFTIRKFILN